MTDFLPQVSVIVIFLDAERFLREALESLLAQTFGAWELVLVDDGSSDGSMAIAQEYVAALGGRARCVEHAGHANRGTSASRNLGLRHATACYIAYLDADDVWPADKLERQVALLDAHPEVAMTYGRIRFWYSWSGRPEDAGRDHFQALGVEPDTTVAPPGLLPNMLRHRHQQIGMPNALIRRSAIEAVGGFEERFRNMGEDYLLFARIAAREYIHVSDACGLYYRQHAASFCHARRQEEAGESYAMLEWLEGYFARQGLTDPAVIGALEQIKFFHRGPAHYFFLRGYLDLAMRAGRRLLPTRLRHWLWVHIGSRLWGAAVDTQATGRHHPGIPSGAGAGTERTASQAPGRDP